jgi:alpha-L-fucosidase
LDLAGIGADKAISSIVVTLDPNAWFKIINCANAMAIDGGGTVSSGSTVRQYPWDGSPNLQWQFVDLGTGWFKIVNRVNRMVIDGAGASQGGSAVEHPWTGATAQQWQPVQISGGWWKIVNRATGLVLDSGGMVASDSPLKQWSWVLDPNLQWRLVKVN